MANERHAIIIGAMKCGTTSLFSMLAQHPQIIGSVVKEPQYFAMPPSDEKVRNFQARPYRALWPDGSHDENVVLLEASTNYTKRPVFRGVAARIANSGLSPRLIYCVRDPLNRIESQYNFSVPRDWFRPGSTMEAESYVNLSRYFYQLTPFIEHFGRDNILIVDFDDIVERPEKVCREIFDFLEVDPSVLIEDMEVLNRTPALRAWERRIYMTRGLSKAYRFLPDRVRLMFRERLSTRADTAEGLKLTNDQRKRIIDTLDDDIAQFGSTFDFPVEKWGFRR